MKDHLFASSIDGALYDTRVPNWYSKQPLRHNYRRHHYRIDSVADLKAALRAGPYAWPGGCPLFLIFDDGATLCFDCLKSVGVISLVMKAIKDQEQRSGWRIVACNENDAMFCAHCNNKIESAYGEK